MKTKILFFGIWSMFLSLSTCTKNSTLKTQLLLLQNPPENKFALNSTGFSENKNSKFFTKSGEAFVLNINSQNIHLVDFNNDGQKDIIYQETRPYQETILLEKKGNDFVEIWSGAGKLVNVKQENETTIHILSYPIGCFNVVQLSELIIENNSTVKENIIAHHADVEIGEINNTFKKKTISGIIRTQPIINNEKKTDPCIADLKIGNQLKTVKNKEAIVLKKQNEWMLVVLKEMDNSIIGWVKI